MTDSVLTVSQLNLYIKSLLDFDEFMSNVWVMGEVSNFKHHSSGHMYLTLKDESASLKAVMFKSSAQLVKFNPENGMKVLVHGRVSVYEREGQYQLYIDEMQPYGAGALYLAFEQLKAKLYREGLFDESHKKQIPAYPEKIAVVTSSKGAAVHDIINVISRRYNMCDILICPVPVQGEGAAPCIAGAIEYVNLKTDVDLIIVGRGGGSAEDLQCFNEEVVARAIYDSKIPVISAVGHETDYTISDFVADVRAATPSVAAELATPSVFELKNYFNFLKTGLNNGIEKIIDSKTQEFENIKELDIAQIMKNFTEQNEQYVCDLADRLRQLLEKIVENKHADFTNEVEKLKILNPLNMISKGYSVVKKEGVVVKSIEDVSVSDKLEIKVSDGIITADVLGKEKK